ncbi:response regulator [Psychroserpens sp.]|uniref:response regulator n=1 Tax=Psychroserpens sp. TaxID=2020870 RepID=UPI001B20D1D1|nr:response regulator [Psychroserpens sp.]MBO6606677.1 response regulator [Psychroserpens sp.]MBO6632655.1 response regulator [Psychroserpens sp.]MBO6653381.1 response regulator [Psychroserpens sp.]MBO6680592.1 response regulator [Psychroserpens sp.]MBO6750450.1 response regulator [Psychroserpens sp.]
MKQKLKCILLIDDDEATNFLHKILIDKEGYTEKCVAVQSGKEALDYLKSKEDGEQPQPELIFLDINMPVMNGWEFLEAYNKLDSEQQGHIVVVMLTTSLNPDDKDKAATIDSIAAFRNKPLTIEMVNELIEEHFTDRL